MNPAPLAHKTLNGTFQFNSTPLTPLVTKHLVHVKPTQQASWGMNALEAFYVGLLMKHFHCYCKIIIATFAGQISDTADRIVDVIRNFHQAIKQQLEEHNDMVISIKTPKGVIGRTIASLKNEPAPYERYYATMIQ